ELMAMDVLDIWYSRIEDADYLAMLPKDRRAALTERIAKATAHPSSELVFPKLAEQDGEEPRIHDRPPLIFHASEARHVGYFDEIKSALATYRETLPEDRRVLLDRMHLVDA